MNIFKQATFTWWQLGILKWSVFLIGIAAGAYWSDFFLPHAPAFVVLGLLGSLYIGYVWLKR